MRTGLWLCAIVLVACTPSAPTPQPPAPHQPEPSPTPLPPAPASPSRKPTAPLAEIVIGTILTPDPTFDARGTLSKNTDRLLPCYQAALTRSPGLRGKMLIRFEVDGSGKVSKVEDAGSALHEPQLSTCVFDAMQHIPFPAPKGTAIVTAPLVFRLASSAD